jgi:hypothetical protein
MKMINKISSILIIFLVAISCNTNPPTSPVIVPTGNIVVNLRVDNNDNIGADSKVVLIEDFANVSCIPCVASNKVIEAVSNSYGSSKLAIVKFPTDFPSPSDPFYLAAKLVCDERMDYYNIIAAPTTIIDGQNRLYSLTDSMTLKTEIDARLSTTSRFGLNVTGSFEGDYVVNIDVKFIDTSGIDLSELVIHTIITETDIEFETPPGSNGETKFYDVTRLMLPAISGTSVRQLIDQGEFTYEFTDALLSGWNLDKISAVIYIQNVNSKEVYQTGSTF